MWQLIIVFKKCCSNCDKLFQWILVLCASYNNHAIKPLSIVTFTIPLTMIMCPIEFLLMYTAHSTRIPHIRAINVINTLSECQWELCMHCLRLSIATGIWGTTVCLIRFGLISVVIFWVPCGSMWSFYPSLKRKGRQCDSRPGIHRRHWRKL